MVESEKALERKLAKDVGALGGWTVKLLSMFVKGLPDRLVLMPKGRVAFAEIKTTKKDTTKMQKFIHRKLRKLGFTVVVLDTSVGIDEFLKIFCENEQ